MLPPPAGGRPPLAGAVRGGYAEPYLGSTPPSLDRLAELLRHDRLVEHLPAGTVSDRSEFRQDHARAVWEDDAADIEVPQGIGAPCKAPLPRAWRAARDPVDLVEDDLALGLVAHGSLLFAWSSIHLSSSEIGTSTRCPTRIVRSSGRIAVYSVLLATPTSFAASVGEMHSG